MMVLYSLGWVVVLLVSSPVWLWRMVRQGRYREGLRGRLGVVPARLSAWVAGRPVIWLHAVSVGETLAATRLVAEMEAALPGWAVVVSTTTPTGQRVARERFGVDRVFFYPLDFAFAVRAYLRVLRPKLVILMESELWPRMLVECARAGVPVAVVNARVSDRSLPRYMALRGLWRPLLGKVRLLLAQSEEDARRWLAIGAPRVEAAGNLKFDVRVPAETALVRLVREYLPVGAKVLVCGSTHEDEEDLLLHCFARLSGGVHGLHTHPSDLRTDGAHGFLGALVDGARGAVMILAPRHPERAAAVAELAAARGLVALRLSQWRVAPSAIGAASQQVSESASQPGAVLIVDTVGELSALYSLAAVAFVGGSLVAHGGQNPLEPAQFGVPVVMGPSYENFRGMVEGMVAAGAIHLVTRETVCDVLSRLMSADDGSGARARAFAASATGATARTVAALVGLLGDGAR